MYKHLLVSTDGSELSTHAVRNAVKFAKSLGARITFLYVQPDYPSPVVGEGALIMAPEDRDGFLREARDQADRILTEANRMAQAESVIANTITQVSDVPYQMIIATAQDEACDLIFMASHGRRGLAGLLIGSETHKVLTHCKIPVLVYRES
ncbi:MAG TPA: universal stress protein [Rhodocyclaceae bacterium]|nr:universal stress protein [Rhodocyclaceae bacterium]